MDFRGYNGVVFFIQSAKKALPNGKVAHLRVVLKSILPAGRNASALLKDPSGEFRGEGCRSGCYNSVTRCAGIEC